MTENPPCGEEGHVCVCEGDTDISKHDFNVSLEEWLIERFKLAVEQLQDPQLDEEGGDMMREMLSGAVITLITCLKAVKITAKHDELSLLLEEAIRVLHRKMPDGAGFMLIEGLIVAKKLEADKKGEVFDWSDYPQKLIPDNPVADSFIAEELKRVFGIVIP